LTSLALATLAQFVMPPMVQRASAAMVIRGFRK